MLDFMPNWKLAKFKHKKVKLKLNCVLPDKCLDSTCVYLKILIINIQNYYFSNIITYINTVTKRFQVHKCGSRNTFSLFVFSGTNTVKSSVFLWYSEALKVHNLWQPQLQSILNYKIFDPFPACLVAFMNLNNCLLSRLLRLFKQLRT